MNIKNNALVNYFKDSWVELRKVTWPTKNKAIKLAMIVLGFCFGAALLFSILDFLFNTGYQYLLKISL
ncbi:MAG: hypothetical protein US89_C0005G0100 [Candidatus Peregrinibacteria bacterium GW2011_GWF2_38_29]|nr:MAG: hypothetical protein US89_C0005G0100 [Candidatus Peregrinibacteria bacterium GW2011_GWF2_38_29]HBB02687.1 preprotein translocase subunit SecE [Candidatus Peregrinibacteria bacterium]